MKRNSLVFCAALSLTLASAMVLANDDTSMSGTPSSGNSQILKSNDTATTPSTPKQPQAMNSRTCMDRNGITYYSGQRGFTRCQDNKEASDKTSKQDEQQGGTIGSDSSNSPNSVDSSNSADSPVSPSTGDTTSGTAPGTGSSSGSNGNS